VVLPELFTVQAAATPDAVAVVHGGGCRGRYAQLDAWSNRLARYLIGLGGAGAVGGGGVAPFGADGLAAVLAVVKNRRPPTYPSTGYPADRISFMLTDAAPGLLVSDRVTSARLPDVAGVVVD
jgi:non-ribosomal peptide synthetase component F